MWLSLALGVLGDVGVDVRGQADLAVAQDLLDDAGRDAGGGEERGAAMPGVVEPGEPEAGRLADADEGAVDVVAGAAGEVVREDGRLLAIRRVDNDTWEELPGRVLERTEAPEAGVPPERTMLSGTSSSQAWA